MKRPHTIQSLHPRVGASFALIPITIGIEAMLWFSVLQMNGGIFGLAEFGMGVLMGVAPVVVFYGGSLLIWCPVVRWTKGKIIRTIYTSVGLAAFVIIAGYAGAWLDPVASIFAMLGAGLIGGGIALIVLNWVWWTAPHLRELRNGVACLECGYDLRAQRQCRCPECGWEFTVAQIVHAYQESATLDD